MERRQLACGVRQLAEHEFRRQAADECRLAACAPQAKTNLHAHDSLRSDIFVMQKLIECVPNFSEGRDADVIRQITDAIASAEGASVLDVDPGATTNRTVVTIVGSPDAVVEAAFRGIRKAAELIDMRKHKGA